MAIASARRPLVLGLVLGVVGIGAAAAFLVARPDGTAAAAPRLERPGALALAGGLFISDSGRNQVIEWRRDGSLTVIAGTGEAGFSGDGGRAVDARLDRPGGLAVARDGTLYVADTANNRVRAISPGGTIRTIAGDGRFGWVTSGTGALAAGLGGPTAVAVGPRGELYIAAGGSSEVLRLTRAGTLERVAGVRRFAGVHGVGGPATRASADGPSGLAFDGAGNLFLAGFNTKRLLVIAPDGRPLEVAVIGSLAGTLLLGVTLSVAPPRPSDFAARVTNPWYPLRPGTVFVYRGVKDGERARDVVTVTRRTKTIQGVRCVVVDDRLYVNGRLAERTADWYSQEKAGNVWYFGEATAELDAKGHVTTREGSWQAGRNGARAGVYMPARPRVGQTGVQEVYKGHAEDHFRVLSLRARVDAPAVSSRSALLTREWTPLEPGVVDHKLYVRGIGLAVERTVKGGDEHFELVAVRR